MQQTILLLPQTQFNKLVAVHPGVGAEAAAAAAYINNTDNDFVIEDMKVNFRVLGNDKWSTKAVRNFESLISARLAQLLGIPFYEDVAECHSSSLSAWLAKKHRVGAAFSFGAKPPKEHNIIVFDDFVTTAQL